MIVLAIDIGETTGYALLRREEDQIELLFHGTTGLTQRMPERFKPDLVAIERPAYVESKMQDRYAEAIHLLRKRYGKKVKVVRPADWMPRFNHYPLPERGLLKTQHEKDAYRMAVWALDQFGGEDGV